jgi:hypothetical protein
MLASWRLAPSFSASSASFQPPTTPGTEHSRNPGAHVNLRAWHAPQPLILRARQLDAPQLGLPSSLDPFEAPAVGEALTCLARYRARFLLTGHPIACARAGRSMGSLQARRGQGLAAAGRVWRVSLPRQLVERCAAARPLPPDFRACCAQCYAEVLTCCVLLQWCSSGGTS